MNLMLQARSKIHQMTTMKMKCLVKLCQKLSLMMQMN